MTSKWNRLYFFRVFCAYLCSAGILMFVVDIMRFSHNLNMMIVCAACAGAMLLLVLITSQFYIMVTFLGGLTLSFLYLYLYQSEKLGALYAYIEKIARWLVPFYQDTARSNPPYESVLFLTMVAVVCLLLYMVSCVFRSTLVLFLLTLAPVIVLNIVTGRSLPYYLMIPGIFGVVFHMSSTARIDKVRAAPQKTTPQGYWQTVLGMIPVISAGLVLMVLLAGVMPAASLRSQGLSDSTNDLLSLLKLPLPNHSNQSGFNLANLGYYPLDVKLGGPVTPSDEIIMNVTSAHDVLLRANLYENYDTHSWSSDSTMFTCRLNSSLAKERTQDVFDMQRPDKTKIPSDLYDSVMEEVTISISYANKGMGCSLFSADHLLDITKESNTVYYNEDQELYFAKNAQYNESYSITYNRFRTERSSFVSSVLALEAYIIDHPEAGDSKSKLKTIADEFLAVDVPYSVESYAKSITSEDSTPLEKVFDIRKDLKTNFTYSLLVDYPPASMDFVENFLNTRTGYCTYFASAMTVMARLNGIPARYVEGFSVQVPLGTKDPTRITVAGKNGHAWCEVYIDGIGWIPVDATPGYFTSGGEVTGDGTDLQPINLDLIRNTSTPSPGDPSHDSTKNADAGGNAGGFPEFAVWVAKAGPAIPPLLISGVLMMAALILLTLRRWQRTFALIPLPTLLEEYTPHALATKFWNQSRRHLSLLSIRIEPEETISDFAKRVGNIPVSISGCGQDTYHFQLTQIAFLYERWIFGRTPPTDEELVQAYDECSATITKVKKAHTSLFYYVLHYLIRAQ